MMFRQKLGWGLLLALIVMICSANLLADDTEWVDTTRYKKDPPYTIGVSVGHSATDWMRMYIEEMKYWVYGRDDLIKDLIIVDANNNISKQISDIEDLLAKKVDALIIDPLSPSANKGIVEKAYMSGIPVIINKNPVETDKFTCYQDSDEREFGRAGAEFLVKELKGKGKIIAIRGVPGYGVDIDRWAGAEEVFKKYPGIKIVGMDYGYWAFDKAKEVTESLLAANPEIDGVWSAGGQMTRAAVEAFLDAKRPLVPMSGEAQYNMLVLWKKYRKQGFKSVAPSKPTFLGAAAIKAAIDILSGIPVQKVVMYPAPVITEKDLDKYIKKELPAHAWCVNGLPDSVIKELFTER